MWKFMNITVLTDSRIKEKHISQGIDEFKKRLSRYGKISLKEAKGRDKLLKEMESLRYVIYVDIGKKLITSEDLAEKIDSLGVNGVSEIGFIVADRSEELEQNTDEVVSLSTLDMDKDLMVLVMLEQIYRAFRIINGEPYHK